MSRRLLFFTIIPILLLLVLGGVYPYADSSIQEVKKREHNLRIKQIMASELTRKIIALRLLFYRTPLVSNRKKLLKLYVKDMLETVYEIKKILHLLGKGGVYIKRLPLNEAGHTSYAEEYRYQKEKTTIEMIKLTPKIQMLQQKIRILEKLIDSRNRESVSGSLKYIRKEIAHFVKKSDTVFKRMIEDANKLLYDAQMDLNSLTVSVKRLGRYYDILIYSIGILLLLSFLTGFYLVVRELKNRLYMDALTKLFSRAKLEEEAFTETSLLFLVDIDDFSDINSLYGVETGDRVLQCIATEIRCFDKAACYRVSGDVFGLYYVDGITDTVVLTEKIEILRSALRKQNLCEIAFSVTIGAARGKQCLHDAFMALDIATSQQEPYHFFDDERNFKEKMAFNKLWHNELSAALKEDRIIPFFQPIVDQNVSIVKYEALMRLKKIEYGEIHYIPPVYLDVAIRTKQYKMLSQRMIEKTFIRFSNEKRMEFSINIVHQDIDTEASREFLKQMITKYDVAGRVIFEILENSFNDQYDLLMQFMTEFRHYGVRFAIDDFGTGYSNAERVISLNPDYIKIDGELIKHMLKEKKSYKMVENITSYAKEFNIMVIAEHIDSIELFQACQRLGIDYFQGYLFSRPKMELQKQLHLDS